MGSKGETYGFSAYPEIDLAVFFVLTPMYYCANDTLHMKYEPYYSIGIIVYMISLGNSCFVPLYHHHI